MPAPKDPKKRKYMFTDDIKFLQKAVVFHPTQNKFLALQRSPDDRARPNDWDLPGGNVHFGENHVDSLKKEVLEETKLKVTEIEPIQVETKYHPNKKLYVIFIGHRCRASSDKIKISSEHSNFKWVTKKGFEELTQTKFLVDLVRKA